MINKVLIEKKKKHLKAYICLSKLLTASPSWSPCLMVRAVLCNQRERWQINSIIPWKAATVSVDEEQLSKRQGNQRDSLIWAWTRSSRWETSEESHRMIFYVLLTQCESFLSLQQWWAPATLWGDVGWQRCEQVDECHAYGFQTTQNSLALLFPNCGCRPGYYAGWSNEIQPF